MSACDCYVDMHKRLNVASTRSASAMGLLPMNVPDDCGPSERNVSTRGAMIGESVAGNEK